MRRIAVLLSLLFPVLAGADVLVTVRIESPSMKARYKPRTAEVEQAIATEIAKLLPQYFRHWKYTPAATASQQDYALQFSIDRQGGAQVVTLTMNTREEIAGTWQAVWMPAGDVAARGFPDRTVAGRRIAEEIAHILVNPKQPEIAARMKLRVPVATAAQWERINGRRESPRLVLPLRWPGSSNFVNSRFRVKCTWPGKGLAELQTVALKEFARYNDVQSRSSYDALTLKPLMRIFDDTRTPVTRIARQVRALEPIVVYLEDDDPMGLHMGVQQ